MIGEEDFMGLDDRDIEDASGNVEAARHHKHSDSSIHYVLMTYEGVLMDFTHAVIRAI